MAENVSISTTIPSEYESNFRNWTFDNVGETATKADGLRAMVTDILGKPRIPLIGPSDPEVLAAREQCDETIAQLRFEGLSWDKIGVATGLNPERARIRHANYERSLKRPVIMAQAKQKGWL